MRAVTPEESEANVKRSREQQAEEERRIKEQGSLEQSRRMIFPGAAPDNDDVIRRRAQIYAREDAERLAEMSLGDRLYLQVWTLLYIEAAGGVLSLLGGAAGRAPRSCFPAGTPVHTALGLKVIERIAAGDRVWAYDHKRLRWAEREVVEVYQLLHQGTMATVQVKGETLRATGGHPFWVVRGEGLTERPSPVRIEAYEAGGRQEGRWVLARDLRAGDQVLLRPGEVVALELVRLDEVEETVYNFHVAELQNYAVGDCGVLVHNTNDPPGLGNIGSHGSVNPSTLLDGASRWLGAGYREIAPGVYRSADGLRQFRMTGLGSTRGPYVNFEALNSAGTVIENLHVPVAP